MTVERLRAAMAGTRDDRLPGTGDTAPSRVREAPMAVVTSKEARDDGDRACRNCGEPTATRGGERYHLDGSGAVACADPSDRWGFLHRRFSGPDDPLLPACPCGGPHDHMGERTVAE